MPLMHGKSKGAFEHNVKAEMHAGKPQKQSLAIAYSMKRKAKKMAQGGMVDEKASGYLPEPMEHEKHNEAAMHEDDIVDKIMAQRMSEGGKVANEGMDEVSHLADGAPNEFDDLVLDDHLESHYGMDGDHLGDAKEDEDRRDIVAQIMKQRKMKQSNPRPA